MTQVRFESVTKRFRGLEATVTALDGVTLDVPSGQFVIIVGHNGSGKSTLLHLLAGREILDEGSLAIEPAQEDSSGAVAPVVRAFVAQDPRRGTAGDLTVEEHLRLARLPPIPSLIGNAMKRGKDSVFRSKAGNLALRTRMSADAETLSGGERQLLALEMAAVMGANLILLDEPTASLDRANANSCLAEIERVHADLRATIFLVTHDLNVAAQIGDRLVVLVEGKVACDMKGKRKKSLTGEDVFRLVESVERKLGT